MKSPFLCATRSASHKLLSHICKMEQFSLGSHNSYYGFWKLPNFLLLEKVVFPLIWFPSRLMGKHLGGPRNLGLHIYGNERLWWLTWCAFLGCLFCINLAYTHLVLHPKLLSLAIFFSQLYVFLCQHSVEFTRIIVWKNDMTDMYQRVVFNFPTLMYLLLPIIVFLKKMHRRRTMLFTK